MFQKFLRNEKNVISRAHEISFVYFSIYLIYIFHEILAQSYVIYNCDFISPSREALPSSEWLTKGETKHETQSL